MPMITIGEELRREREFREISLREISDATKINIRMLEAIEKDNFSALPGGIFIRNFIRAYAEFIGLDAEVIIRKYQVQAGVQQEPQQLPPTIASSAKLEKKSLQIRWILLALLLLIVVLIFVLLWKYPEKVGLSTSAGHPLDTVFYS